MTGPKWATLSDDGEEEEDGPVNPRTAVGNGLFSPRSADSEGGEAPRLRPVYPADPAGALGPNRLARRAGRRRGGRADRRSRSRRRSSSTTGCRASPRRTGGSTPRRPRRDRRGASPAGVQRAARARQLGVAVKRAHTRLKLRAPRLPCPPALREGIAELLPFEMTKAQQRVVGEIAHDLARPLPMNRLLQGDVGSGKTAVALFAMLIAQAAGKQAALMAPTAPLAEQHHQAIERMLEGTGVRVGLITASHRADVEVVAGLGLDGTGVDLVVGTHALLSEKRRLPRPRARRDRRAAPIRRAAACSTPLRGPGFAARSGDDGDADPAARFSLTLLGDLDVSTIDELPPGSHPRRQPRRHAREGARGLRLRRETHRRRRAGLRGCPVDRARREHRPRCAGAEEHRGVPARARGDAARPADRGRPRPAQARGPPRGLWQSSAATRATCCWRRRSSRSAWTCPTPPS